MQGRLCNWYFYGMVGLWEEEELNCKYIERAKRIEEGYMQGRICTFTGWLVYVNSLLTIVYTLIKKRKKICLIYICEENFSPYFFSPYISGNPEGSGCKVFGPYRSPFLSRKSFVSS